MMKIRPAELPDAEEIVALVESCYRGDASKAGWTTEADLLDGNRTDRIEVENLITRSHSAILLCVDRDEIVGSVHIERQVPACYLGMLSVRPRLQGGGVGSMLIDAAERHAREEWRADRMTMNVLSVRRELVAYYERRGYTRTGEKTKFGGAGVHGIPRVEGLEFIVLEKPISGK